MADDKSGREEQAQNADRRQRERALATELARGDEPEPPFEPAVLVDFEAKLEPLSFPVTGAEVVAAVGDHVIESTDGEYAVEELLAETDVETFDSPTALRARIQRPTVAAMMKQVVEAAATLRNAKLSQSQRDAYEKTFRELVAVDAIDDDEGLQVVTDWIVERIDEKGTIPGSRDVRRRASKYCRENGYQVRNDEWLGV
ncbi:hypothetical protein GJ629_13030 [Halapricum sp. CBA1109]|uniref:DUF5789 family protein n=1 Tax=Halapricum sp. CBA1109 TaxID=2668068 RepID=UPI0012FCD25B|nr:hypothetical protein [Halapricum sp. CBA1109]MUV90709.1 hypothetical protein [Halapricum sp. CBA1109]